jgi:putative heme-binding domain-containing protein
MKSSSFLPFRFIVLIGAVCGILSSAVDGDQRQATAPQSIRARDGFRVELLRSAQEGEGSWISMAFDQRGRVIVGLDDRGLARLVVDDGKPQATFQRIAGTESLLHIRGVLHAHDSLYISATNSQGIYRMRQHGDSFHPPELIQALPYTSRYGHGTNQITLGPDNMIYFVIGNDVVFPPAMATDSPYRDPQNDWLLPGRHDGGHDQRVGYIAKVDSEGKSWEVVAGGFRNQVDVAFNEHGEMFTWDADMEWDLGLPWYRPTRLNHVIAGGEYGWRWGTGKWPDWYPDSLPSTLDTGLGSPTGMVFGHASNWPQRYRQALYMADWQFGRILMVDTKPQGSTYEASSQWFLEGGPLNVCDLTFGPDGALYFITGGRGSQSGLYRVTWVGESQPDRLVTPAGTEEKSADLAAQSRQVRKRLETYHRLVDPSALQWIWSQLDSDDLWLRFSARVALENQPLDLWRTFIADANDSIGLYTGLLALARVGQPEDQSQLVQRLVESRWSEAELSRWLLPLRTLQVSIVRHGLPDAALQRRLLDRLEPLYPQDDFRVNWLLQELLVKLESPDVLAKSLDLIDNASTQEEQIQYAKTLTYVDWGWDEQSAGRIVAWLGRTGNLPGGKLVKTTWQNLRGDFVSLWDQPTLNRWHAELADLDTPRPEESESVPTPRPLVRRWTIDDLIDDIAVLQPENRSVERGHKALADALCLRCHRFGQRGSPVGPDLTDVGKRFDGRALLESIIDPSRQVDPKYFHASFLMTDGRVVTGRTVGVSKTHLTIEVDPITARTVAIDRDEIEMSLQSPRSPMPDGLLDTLSREEVLDLIALLRR